MFLYVVPVELMVVVFVECFGWKLTKANDGYAGASSGEILGVKIAHFGGNSKSLIGRFSTIIIDQRMMYNSRWSSLRTMMLINGNHGIVVGVSLWAKECKKRQVF